MVILIFWLYLTALAALAVLLGAEINAESEREAAAQAGHPQAKASAAHNQGGKNGWQVRAQEDNHR